MLLNAEPALLTLPDQQGTPPAHHASAQETPDMLCTLLDFAPPKKLAVAALDVNAREGMMGRTCLHYAVAYNRPRAAALLVGRGADVEARDNEGKTAMDYATELSEGKEEMLAALRG